MALFDKPKQQLSFSQFAIKNFPNEIDLIRKRLEIYRDYMHINQQNTVISNNIYYKLNNGQL
jgi:hypothetical protein